MRVLVIGLPGSGKTTFAGALSRLSQTPHIEVDQIFWGEYRGDVSSEVLNDNIRKRIEQGNWILEGHFSKISASVLPEAETLIWLDYPLRTLVYRSLRRSWLRKDLSFWPLFRMGGRKRNFEDAVSYFEERGRVVVRFRRSEEAELYLKKFP